MGQCGAVIEVCLYVYLIFIYFISFIDIINGILMQRQGYVDMFIDVAYLKWQRYGF